MRRKIIGKLQQRRWTAGLLLFCALFIGGWYVHHTDERAINAANNAAAAGNDSAKAARAAALSATAAARSARHSQDANCDAIETVAKTVNPVNKSLKQLVDSFLVDKAKTLERADTAVRIAPSPAARRAALVARRQTKETIDTFEKISKAATQIPDLKCREEHSG